jgi:hypothetical protein
MRRPTKRSLAGGAAGIAAGILGGIALTPGSAGNLAVPASEQFIDAGHVPPALTLPGEPVTLRYAIVCAPREDGRPCDGSGDVFVRPGQSGPFERLALQRGADSADGRYFVHVPGEIASDRDGFSYYAVLRDASTGAEMTVPTGGPAAPQISLPLRKTVNVDLGAHAFGRTRHRDARVVTAEWGSRPGQAGLAGSRELGFTGPSAIDVEVNGTVTMLDQVNRRLLRWHDGRVSATNADVSGGLADIAVEPDGTVDVLEPPNRVTPVPMLRKLGRDGALTWAQRLSDRTWSKLETGPEGPVVLAAPSEQWVPAAAHGAPLDRATQAKRAKPGRRTAAGRDVIVDRIGADELRLAETSGHTVVRSWRVTSSTALGEVQLADSVGNRLVVVLKTYIDDRAEYVVLVLDRAGVVRQFSVDATEWAESAPLARFRLASGSLYHLGSTPSEAFVDRFDLEVSP